MAAFSRGLWPSSSLMFKPASISAATALKRIGSPTSSSSPSFLPARLATTNASSRAVFSSHNLSPFACARMLANRPQPTLLYEAPSHAAMFVAHWLGGTVMFASLAIPSVLAITGPTAGLSPWVIPAYFFSVSSSVAIGIGFVYAVTGTVKAIWALPNRTRSPDQPLRLRIEIKRLVPLLKPAVVEAPAAHVKLEAGALAPLLAVPQEEWDLLRSEMKRVEEERKEYDEAHPYTRPFRDVGQGIATFLRRLAYSISRREFSTLTVETPPGNNNSNNGKKRRLQIHTTGGWALDNGNALELVLGDIKNTWRR